MTHEEKIERIVETIGEEVEFLERLVARLARLMEQGDIKPVIHKK